MKEHILDAAGKSLGRVASQAAVLLMGKDEPTYVRHIAPDVKVRITNASQLAIPVKKREQEVYRHYTGYPGGLREATMQEVVDKKGYSEIMRRAVEGMLPKNKLKKVMMKNLEISE